MRITKEEKSKELLKKITETVPGGAANVNGLLHQYIWEYYALGIFFFLGLIMSIIFMLATFSTIYFKILSDALADKEQYSILKKVGMSKKEVGKSIYLQVGIAFLLPGIVGIIHSAVAINILEQIMGMSFTLPLIYGIGLFVIVMIAFYIGISKNYTKMVYEK
ncbi:FtsX-like permease family protein [Mesobacillus zeae]|uniref:FtsX-like permease family protein n=2 Tax=Mesobacillus zeae TaxID=1917180 RepID=UPI001FE4352C|nr:FtsX-like permease family protein [Mesobacillus zeae]